jgi:hypothetical protein
MTRQSVIPVTRTDGPSWNDLEKAMYAGTVPLGGDLLAVLFATEKNTQSVDDKEGKTSTRVRVGPFGSREEADQVAARIRALGFSPAVLRL